MSDEPIEEQAAPSSPAGEYLVVARRYRPMAFDELVGQTHVAAALSNAVETGRVGHAYLFTGARGVGKTSAARILAKALNCVSGPTSSPCNTCDICQSIASGDDVDVLEIDGASNRGIDEIRQLRQNAGVRPSRARLKIYIIDEVHMLTKEAFNALLKTLEEPPEHVKFIFATTEPNKIPVTILSRCQRFDFAGIDVAAIEGRLAEIASAEGITIEPEALQIIARRAAGSMRDGQSLLEQLLSLNQKQITPEDVHALLGTAPEARVSKLIERLADRDAPGALAQLDDALAQGVEVQQLMDQLLAYYRDVMAAAVGCSEAELLHVTRSETENVASLGQRLGVEAVLAAMQILEQAATRMRLSTHDRALAEMAIVRIASLENLDDLSALIEGLQGMEAGPPAAGGRTAPPPAGRVPAQSKKTSARGLSIPPLPRQPSPRLRLRSSCRSAS